MPGPKNFKPPGEKRACECRVSAWLYPEERDRATSVVGVRRRPPPFCANLIVVPLGIVVGHFEAEVAVGDDLEWWTILGLGSLLGLVGAALFGMLGGSTLAAHVFEDVDRGVGLEADAH